MAVQRARRVAVGVLVFGAVGLVAAPAEPAGAEVDGPCEVLVDGATVAGLDSGDPGDAIEVEPDQAVTVLISTPGGLQSHSIGLEYAGIGWSVSSGSDGGESTVDGTVDVGDYSRFGVGLYKVTGKATLSSGERCSGAALVLVGGSPLATVAGATAAIAAALGTAGVGTATTRAAKRAAKAARAEGR